MEFRRVLFRSEDGRGQRALPAGRGPVHAQGLAGGRREFLTIFNPVHHARTLAMLPYFAAWNRSTMMTHAVTRWMGTGLLALALALAACSNKVEQEHAVGGDGFAAAPAAPRAGNGAEDMPAMLAYEQHRMEEHTSELQSLMR